SWFQNDDFAWMSLPDWVHDSGLAYALFHPFAQGTVRVFSERVPFLAFSALFGLNPLPFHILAFLTWIVVLILVVSIGQMLTGSLTAGLVSAIFLAINASLTRPLAWPSDYNEVLCAACILMAFYARLRGWRLAEWVAYLVGFGVLEVIVVYPALAILH